MEENNWKMFQGSELGALMTSLYGGKNSRALINYPKPQSNKTRKPLEKWRPVSNKPTAVDPRTTTRRNVSVKVPKHVLSQSNISMIDCIPRRKAESDIINEIQ